MENRKGMLTLSSSTSIVYASSDFSAIFDVFRLGEQALKQTGGGGGIHADMKAGKGDRMRARDGSHRVVIL
jgi:hypothetical protein